MSTTRPPFASQWVRVSNSRLDSSCGEAHGGVQDVSQLRCRVYPGAQRLDHRVGVGKVSTLEGSPILTTSVQAIPGWGV